MIADYILNHQAQLWLVIGFSMLVIEVVTGVFAGIFLFGGLGALTTGLLMTFGVLPETWLAGVSCTGISSGVIAAILWKPLRKLQGDRPRRKDNSSDLTGYEFVVDSDVTANMPGSVNYSGITWKVELDKDAGVDIIQTGQRVSVTSVEVGTFKVKAIQ